MKRIAVTGAGGFIGRAVCEAALRSGASVLALGPGAPPIHPRLQHRSGRIGDPAALAAELSGISVLIHAAGHGTPASITSFSGLVAQTELHLAGCVIDAAAAAGVAKLVLVSSGGTLYGDPAHSPITEQQPVTPACRYGAVKAAIEQLGFAMTRLGGVACVAARLSNPYGPGQTGRRDQGLVGTIFARLRRGDPIEIWGDGTTIRDYLFVGDAARGLLAAAELPGGSVCHVSSGVGRPTGQVVADVAAAAGARPDIIYRGDRDPGVSRNVLCSALLTDRTGWRAEVGWDDGLASTAAWIIGTMVTP